MEIIKNVRQAEGYSMDLVDAEMEKVSRIYDKYNTPLDSLTGKMLQLFIIDKQQFVIYIVFVGKIVV